jgi:hypothetical protein
LGADRSVIARHLRKTMHVGRLAVGGAIVLARCATCALAAADEAPRDPACQGTHSLLSPLPDRCLDVIDTDRPHQTDTPHVVPAGHVQLESAVASLELGGAVSAPKTSRAAHVVFLEDGYKFGLVSNVDLQLIMKHAEYVPADRRFAPPGPLLVRTKLAVVAERGLIPAVTLVPSVFVPFARSEAARGGPLVFWGWELPAGFELEMNAGLLVSARHRAPAEQGASREAPPKPLAALVLASALTFTIGHDVRTFVDVYATGPDIAFGTGALWAFTRDAQVDLGTYVGVNGDEPVATPFVGLSVRR